MGFLTNTIGTIGRAVALAAAVMMVPGCAGKPSPTTVPPGSTLESQTTAFYAYKGLRAVEVFQRTIIDLNTAKKVPDDFALDALNKARRAGVAGEKLADALEVYDRLKAAAQSTTGSAASINALIDEFEKAANAIAGLPTGNAAIDAIKSFVTDVVSAINSLKATFKGTARLQEMRDLTMASRAILGLLGDATSVQTPHLHPSAALAP